MLMMGSYYFYFITATEVSKNLFREQFADSFYALGFLLTLTALVFTFIPFFINGGKITMQGTLGNFGVALLTTLLGLSVRIYLTSFSKDVDKLQEEVAFELSQKIQLFKEEMDESIKTMQGFNTNLKETTNNTVRDFGESLEGAGQEITKLVETTMTNAFTPLAGAFNQIAEDVRGSTGSFGENLGKAFDGCVASVENIKLEPDLLTRAVAPMMADIEKTGKQMGEGAASVASSITAGQIRLDNAMKNFATSVEGINTNLLESVQAMSDTFGAMTVNPEKLNELLEAAFEDFKAAVAGIADQTRKHGTALEGSATAINKSLPAYETLVENLGYIVSLNETLSDSEDIFDDLNTKITDLALGLESLKSQTDKFTNTVKESVETHKTKGRDLEKEREGINTVREKLTAEYDAVVKEIKNLGDTFTGIAKFIHHELSPQEN